MAKQATTVTTVMVTTRSSRVALQRQTVIEERGSGRGSRLKVLPVIPDQVGMEAEGLLMGTGGDLLTSVLKHWSSIRDFDGSLTACLNEASKV